MKIGSGEQHHLAGREDEIADQQPLAAPLADEGLVGDVGRDRRDEPDEEDDDVARVASGQAHAVAQHEAGRDQHRARERGP